MDALHHRKNVLLALGDERPVLDRIESLELYPASPNPSQSPEADDALSRNWTPLACRNGPTRRVEDNREGKTLQPGHDWLAYRDHDVRPASPYYSVYSFRCAFKVLSLHVRRPPVRIRRQQKKILFPSFFTLHAGYSVPFTILPQPTIRRQTSKLSAVARRLCSDSDMTCQTSKRTENRTYSRLHTVTIRKLPRERR